MFYKIGAQWIVADLFTFLLCSSGGTGRIVTACHLACLTVFKDKAPPAKAMSSARRLILRHEGLQRFRPGVFVERSTPENSVLLKSRLDLWFENESAAEVALETFTSKILRARAKRGKHVRNGLSNINSSS